MESIYSDSFDQKSSEKALDTEHRKKINFNIGKYNAVVPKGKMQFVDLEKVKSKYTMYAMVALAFAAGTGWLNSVHLPHLLKLLGL